MIFLWHTLLNKLFNSLTGCFKIEILIAIVFFVRCRAGSNPHFWVWATLGLLRSVCQRIFWLIYGFASNIWLQQQSGERGRRREAGGGRALTFLGLIFLAHKSGLTTRGCVGVFFWHQQHSLFFSILVYVSVSTYAYVSRGYFFRIFFSKEYCE